MRTTCYHTPFFRKEVKSLGATPVRLSACEALEALVGDGLRDTDAACRVFAETLECPAMADRVRLEVCLRLECAGWYCSEKFDAFWKEEEWTLGEFPGIAGTVLARGRTPGLVEIPAQLTACRFPAV